MFKFFMYLLIVSSFCCAQKRLVSDSTAVVLCWEDVQADPATSYLLYYKNFSSDDTVWKYLGTTKLTNYSVARSTRKSIVFGVKSVLFDDTSLIHSSLDETACSSDDLVCGNCTELGPWYLRWLLRKPSKLGKRK